MQPVEVTVELELPEGVEFVEYCRVGEGHGFHVRWTPEDEIRCSRCKQVEAVVPSTKNTFYTVRDLDLWGQPTFLVHQPLQHACSQCGHRQHLVPPFKRKDTQYSFRFEADVLRRLRGSTVSAVAQELGIDAGTVEWIVEQQIDDAQAKKVDPTRTITDVGIDEISLRKGHRLYATLLWDLTHPKPVLLAAAQGRDEAAVQACAEKLTEKQRKEVKTVRSDRGAAMLTATKYFDQAQRVIDRFHVAKRVGEFADGLRKK
jgi:transposase